MRANAPNNRNQENQAIVYNINEIFVVWFKNVQKTFSIKSALWC